MSNSYSFHEGTIPLLISVPHDGRKIPKDIESRMTAAGRSMVDTDWHVAQLYEFGRRLGASMIVAGYSRYVVDLNRPANDEVMYAGQTSTGLCPLQTFSGDNIYDDVNAIDAAETTDRIERYWNPYHDKIAATLEAFREQHGYALLWDAHSIPSVVPRLFDGELPELNIGTWGGRSCAQKIAQAVVSRAESGEYETVLNARFQGGYITRHYGQPDRQIHAIQLEIAQRAYMDETSLQLEESRLSRLRDSLKSMLDVFISAAAQRVQ
jgi:N-formylglutamate deformylase